MSIRIINPDSNANPMIVIDGKELTELVRQVVIDQGLGDRSVEMIQAADRWNDRCIWPVHELLIMVSNIPNSSPEEKIDNE